MQLYAGSSRDFIEQAALKTIAEKIGDAFYDYYRFRASASEFNSWRNSLAALATQFRYSGVLDHGVVVEMQLPLSSSRLDCLVFGRSASGLVNLPRLGTPRSSGPARAFWTASETRTASF